MTFFTHVMIIFCFVFHRIHIMLVPIHLIAVHLMLAFLNLG